MKLKHLLFISTFIVTFLFSNVISKGQTTINFDTPGNWIQDGSTSFTSYGAHAYSESGVLIQGTNVLRNGTSAQDGFPGALGTYSMRVGNTAVSQVLISVASGGISTFSIDVRRWDGTPIPNYSVRYSLDGGFNWTNLANIDGTLLTTSNWFTYNGSINGANDNIQIEIKNTGTTERIMLDNFTWTGFSGGNMIPVITNIVKNPNALIQSNHTVSVSADVTDSDGTVDLVELHWGTASDDLVNTISMSLSGGNAYVTNQSIPQHVNGVTVYYEVYAEDNDGGNQTSILQNYLVAPYVFEELFTSDLGGFTTFSVAGDTKYWMQNAGAAQMNGYNSSELENDWLISPAMNLTGEELSLSFESWKRFGITDSENYLKFYYSLDYDGVSDPTLFTWTEISFTQPSDEQIWTSSGKIALSQIVGNSVYFGFQYQYNVGNYVQWNIDNFRVEKKTYSVTFNITDGTDPAGTDPVMDATIDFYSTELMSNSLGESIRYWVEPGSFPFTITKQGFHNYTGVVEILDKNIVSKVKMLDTAVAIDVVAEPDANYAKISWTGTGADSYRILYYVKGTSNNNFLTATTNPDTISVVPNTDYEVRIKSLINGVWSDYSPVVEFGSLAGVQVIASNVAVTPDINTAAVTWDGVGATDYRILYYVKGTTNYQFVSSSTSPATISVLPDTDYVIKIKTLANGEWSSYSTAVEFRTLVGSQVVADNVAVTPDINTAEVTWNGSGATEYRILYYEKGTNNNQFTSSLSSPATISVLPDKDYILKIKTLVGGQWSSYSTPVEFRSLAGAQIVADNVMVTPGINTADVTWDGTGSLNYRILYYVKGTTNNQFLSTTSSPATIAVLPATTYVLKIKTWLNGVWSSYSTPVEFTSLASPAPAPMVQTNTGKDKDEIVNEVLLDITISEIYPNPAVDHFIVNLNFEELNQIKVTIIDLNGRVIKTFNRTVQNQTESFNVEDLKAGIYLIKISSSELTETHRLIKK